MKPYVFAYQCPECPGDGVVRGARPGIDWPRACVCRARSGFTQYQLARVLEVSPKTIMRVHLLRSRPATAERVLGLLAHHGFLPGASRAKPKRRRR